MTREEKYKKARSEAWHKAKDVKDRIERLKAEYLYLDKKTMFR